MDKVKFTIKGMTCNSCSTLIEEHLKKHAGVVSAKVNQESEKAVVVFEENKIKKNDLKQIIEQAGNFQAEEIIEKSREVENAAPTNQVRQNQPAYSEIGWWENPNPKNSFVLGILAGVAFVSLLVNIWLASVLFSGTSVSAKNSGANLPSVKGVAAQNDPSAPSPAPAAIQDFTITKQDHVRGDFDAPITLVEFSDFECPFCERHYPTMKKVLADYKGKVRLVYKHFPLSFHPNSQKAAESSECADEQGKFWEYHDKLFENQASGFSVDKFKQWAKDLGLNESKFNDCLDTDKYASKVQADFSEGQAKGVNGTPATFVNGQLVSGAVPYESFKQAIDSLLK